MDKMERWKILADNYLSENKQIVIKDIKDNLYFGDILLNGETKITIFCTAPKQRENTKITLYWAEITYFDLKKEGVNNGARY